MPDVVVIGAGLAGSLLSIYLARRGFDVAIYEARGDMRRDTVSAGRSINLALSDRGIAALREVGMDAYVLAEAVPMHGRMVHSQLGETRLLPYSGRTGEYINSISRSGLNAALVTEAEKYANVSIRFKSRCVGMGSDGTSAIFADETRTSRAPIIATDGAGSAVRRSLEDASGKIEPKTTFLEHGYKELHIPPTSGGGFRLERNALHIWPRHQFMMIALPNFDGSFTCTLFLSHKGAKSFEQLTNENAVEKFFQHEFPDALLHMPTLVEDFFRNPTGELGTVKCKPWHRGGEVLLLGDAAHAMVPFYGQGMNCAFEDVRVLNSLIEGSDWENAFSRFEAMRRPNADAIQDMAVENFYEMRDATADPVFVRKRELETRLEQTYTDYFSKYSMVTFREDMPYVDAQRRGNAQDRLLMSICATVDSVSSLDLGVVIDQVRRELGPRR